MIEQLQEEYGTILFIHSEGCCDGTSPVCMTEGDFYLGSQDEKIGEVSGSSYYMHKANFSYWQHLQIMIDVSDGMGNSFSLESTKNKSFVIRATELINDK
ncbi:acetaldehyde dehydrogenase [Halobacillus faecis]|uniref:Acetaldehyde dehydrogenase n=1 Tax=Halobacillus faecis TaxID=360184 RepID=A0A511WRC5_9BACI|nr:acetaldehyde dehydrogenase [Halobacillus faecis]